MEMLLLLLQTLLQLPASPQMPHARKTSVCDTPGGRCQLKTGHEEAVNRRERGTAQAQPPAEPGHVLECLQQQQSCLGCTNLPVHSPTAQALHVPGQGKERSQGFGSHWGRSSSRNKEQRVGSSWELREALGRSRAGPGTNPARGVPAGPNFLGTASRAPGKGLWKQREQQSWRCCRSPFTVTFPGAAERAWALPLPSSPCSKGQCPSALDQRWKQLQARALMKPALESLSLGKGGVIQHKQLSGAAPALAVVPQPPPSPSQALHEQQHCCPCPQRDGFLLHCTLSNMSRPPQFHLAQHSTLPQLLRPAASVDFSMKHDFPSHCHLPRDGIMSCFQAWEFWDCSSLLSQGTQALSSQHVPLKPL